MKNIHKLNFFFKNMGCLSDKTIAKKHARDSHKGLITEN